MRTADKKTDPVEYIPTSTGQPAVCRQWSSQADPKWNQAAKVSVTLSMERQEIRQLVGRPEAVTGTSVRAQHIRTHTRIHAHPHTRNMARTCTVPWEALQQDKNLAHRLQYSAALGPEGRVVLLVVLRSGRTSGNGHRTEPIDRR